MYKGTTGMFRFHRSVSRTCNCIEVLSGAVRLWRHSRASVGMPLASAGYVKLRMTAAPICMAVWIAGPRRSWSTSVTDPPQSGARIKWWSEWLGHILHC